MLNIRCEKKAESAGDQGPFAARGRLPGLPGLPRRPRYLATQGRRPVRAGGAPPGVQNKTCKNQKPIGKSVEEPGPAAPASCAASDPVIKPAEEQADRGASRAPIRSYSEIQIEEAALFGHGECPDDMPPAARDGRKS